MGGAGGQGPQGWKGLVQDTLPRFHPQPSDSPPTHLQDRGLIWGRWPAAPSPWSLVTFCLKKRGPDLWHGGGAHGAHPGASRSRPSAPRS